MNILYHYPICPLSRQIRVLMQELNLSFNIIKENYWQRRAGFLKINPAGTLPVLEEEGNVIVGIYPIIEYLHEKYQHFNFINYDLNARCEVRRLLDWFNNKFYREVTKVIIDEKIIKRLISRQAPRVEFIKIAKTNLTQHLQYLSSLLEHRSFVAGESLSYADIAASCNLCVLDYFGEINWNSYSLVKEWYSILKSRPSFRTILQDKIPGFNPSPVYSNLDF